MLWNKAIVIISVEILIGFICGRIMIPYFRKLKTGKLELYIGDRFKQDGSEPLFGGVVIAIALIFGTMLGIGSVSTDINDTSGLSLQYVALICFCLLLMLVGVAEDYLKDVKKSFTGIKAITKLTVEFVICLAFLLLLKGFCGEDTTKILLPFRLGYVDFKLLYYPLMALGMTVTVNAVKVHDCFGKDIKSGADGLCPLSAMIYSLFFAVYGSIIGNVYLSTFGYVFAAACAGFLIWGISPSKIYPGQSGALLLGGAVSGLAVISKLHLLVFTAGLGFFADGICSAIQYIIYRKNKKLLFKGNSLHAHFKAKGYSDYKIMIIFSIIGIAGGLVGVAFAVYSTKIM